VQEFKKGAESNSQIFFIAAQLSSGEQDSNPNPMQASTWRHGDGNGMEL